MDQTNSIGQQSEVWSNWWEKLSPEDEIRMWDYYGGRQWVSKYIPRFGKTVEAGCGLGRYNFYFSRLGIDIEGIDFSEPVINLLNKWKLKYNFEVPFKVGDVTNLPYEDNSLRGYISLGVIEHFIEGPHKALAEAFRVLEPGGIAIITTPSISWNVYRLRIKKKLKSFVKKLIRYKSKPEIFFQYEYRPLTLKKFIEEAGLFVTVYESADLLYSFLEFGNFNGKNIKYGTFGYWFSNKFENTFLRTLGSQAITISVKLSNIMYCFLCGEKNAQTDSLEKFTIPLCKGCQGANLSKYYRKGVLPKYAAPYLIEPPIKKPTKEICEFSGEEYYSDELFEDYGFTKKVSPKMLRNPEINIRLGNEFIQPIWRNRKPKNLNI